MLEFSTTTHGPALRALGEELLRRLDPVAGALPRRVAGGVLLDQRLPAEADREEVARVVTGFVSEGLSLDQVLERVDASRQLVWSECVARASRVVDAAGALGPVGSLLSTWHGVMTATAVETFGRLEHARRVGDTGDRAAALHGLLAGNVSPRDVPELLAVGNDGALQWRALRARPGPWATVAVLEEGLEPAVARAGGHVAVLGGEVHGIVAGRPRLRQEIGYVALGPPGNAHALPSSFLMATRVLEAAQAFDVRGVTEMENVGLRLAVVEAKTVGNEVVRRCLGPLLGLGAFGRELRATLAAYMENGARVDPTAAALGVHPNTVRHRLRRYEATTGVDLQSMDDLVELWWALERDLVDAAAAG